MAEFELTPEEAKALVEAARKMNRAFREMGEVMRGLTPTLQALSRVAGELNAKVEAAEFEELWDDFVPVDPYAK